MTFARRQAPEPFSTLQNSLAEEEAAAEAGRASKGGSADDRDPALPGGGGEGVKAKVADYGRIARSRSRESSPLKLAISDTGGRDEKAQRNICRQFRLIFSPSLPTDDGEEEAAGDGSSGAAPSKPAAPTVIGGAEVEVASAAVAGGANNAGGPPLPKVDRGEKRKRAPPPPSGEASEAAAAEEEEEEGRRWAF